MPEKIKEKSVIEISKDLRKEAKEKVHKFITVFENKSKLSFEIFGTSIPIPLSVGKQKLHIDLGETLEYSSDNAGDLWSRFSYVEFVGENAHANCRERPGWKKYDPFRNVEFVTDFYSEYPISVTLYNGEDPFTIWPHVPMKRSVQLFSRFVGASKVIISQGFWASRKYEKPSSHVVESYTKRSKKELQKIIEKQQISIQKAGKRSVDHILKLD